MNTVTYYFLNNVGTAVAYTKARSQHGFLFKQKNVTLSETKNMKKTILTGALALALGTAASSASALSIDITSMTFGSTSAASGTIDTATTGDTFTGTFFSAPWIATTLSTYTTVGVPQTFAGSSTYYDDPATTADEGAYSYNFTLTAGQVAFGTYFTWSVNPDIPVLAIIDCGAGNPGDTCTGVGTPMQIGPFPGQAPAFNGVVSAVPVPAAVWLFGSGLLGLVGVARRRKQA